MELRWLLQNKRDTTMIYRRLWMFLLILAGTLLVDAQETLSIDNFRIARGETKEIAINLNNTSSVRALQVQTIY